MPAPSFLYTLLGTTPKYADNAVLFRDLQDLYNTANQLVKFLATELIGSVSMKPVAFADPKYVAADGTAFPADAGGAIALWGANTPDLSGLATTDSAAFIRIYL